MQYHVTLLDNWTLKERLFPSLLRRKISDRWGYGHSKVGTPFTSTSRVNCYSQVEVKESKVVAGRTLVFGTTSASDG
jgi:hypothetical protein